MQPFLQGFFLRHSEGVRKGKVLGMRFQPPAQVFVFPYGNSPTILFLLFYLPHNNRNYKNIAKVEERSGEET